MGPTGQTGAASQTTGPTGPTGPAGSSRVKVANGSLVLTSGTTDRTSVASCDPGWHAVSGGFEIETDFAEIFNLTSRPVVESADSAPTGWRVRVVKFGTDELVFTAYALCVED
jgi:hypothetical protein